MPLKRSIFSYNNLIYSKDKAVFRKTVIIKQFLLLKVYFCTMENVVELQESEEQELYEHLKIIVDKGQSLLRIDKF